MIIGIGGVSRSGKTSLAHLIKDIVEKHGQSGIVLSMDDYVFPDDLLPRIQDRIDWECPDSVDYQRYRNDILDKNKTYDYVIAEGILNYCDDKMIKLFNKCLFTNVNKDVYWTRRSKETRWGIEPTWFLEHVWDSYLKYGRQILFEPPQQGLLLLSGESPFDIKVIENFILK